MRLLLFAFMFIRNLFRGSDLSVQVVVGFHGVLQRSPIRSRVGYSLMNGSKPFPRVCCTVMVEVRDCFQIGSFGDDVCDIGWGLRERCFVKFEGTLFKSP